VYQEGDRIMSVNYTVSGDTFVPGKTRVRIEKLGANEEDWDLAPDGKILAVTPVAGAQSSGSTAEHHITFLLNFADEVKRRVH
jgi:hypothetical protein